MLYLKVAELLSAGLQTAIDQIRAGKLCLSSTVKQGAWASGQVRAGGDRGAGGSPGAAASGGSREPAGSVASGGSGELAGQ